MSLAGADPLAAAQAGRSLGAGPYPDPDFRQLDSWIVIRENNTATFYVGKTDLGQGTGTAFRQLMADELDLAYDATSCVMGNTDVTVDQGGSGGSDALQVDGWPMRRVAAEARRVLLEMGSQRLGVPVDQLAVSAGVITSKADPTRRVTYGELIGGRRFNVTLTGDQIDATTGAAKLKAGAGTEDRRAVAAALRHPRQGGRLGEVGGRRPDPGYGSRAQREAAVRRRNAGQPRRGVGAEHPGVHQRRAARATTWRWSASARNMRSRRRVSSR